MSLFSDPKIKEILSKNQLEIVLEGQRPKTEWNFSQKPIEIDLADPGPNCMQDKQEHKGFRV